MASTNPPSAGGPAPAPSPASGAKDSKDNDSNAKDDKKDTPTEKKPATKKKTTKKKKAADGEGGTTKKKTVRRKKPTAKASAGSASNAAILQAAKLAQSDLADSRAFSAARRTDPLWYRIEDVLPPATTGKSKADTHHQQLMASHSSTVLPEQIQIVEAALANNYMTRSDVTPQAMACLLEQARRYAQELLEDAQDYAAHAGGMFDTTTTTESGKSSSGAGATASLPEPTPRDYLLAAEMRPDHPQAVTAQLPKLNLLAQQVNATPLPPVPPQCYSGVLLPPPPRVLTARTFDVISGAHVAQKMIQAAPAPPKAFSSSLASSNNATSTSTGSSNNNDGTTSSFGTKKKSSKTGYGASRGAQIPIHLKKNAADSSSSAMDTSK